MVSVTIPRALTAAAVVGAIVLVQLARDPADISRSAPFEVPPLPAREEPAAIAVAEPASAPTEAPAAVKQRELEAMSETFRNTTFLIAIRDAGFDCRELLRVVGGLDGSTKWLATCNEMRAYTVAVTGDGTLHVAPMMQYFDGVGVRPVEQDFNVPPQSLPQQLLPPQSLPPPR